MQVGGWCGIAFVVGCVGPQDVSPPVWQPDAQTEVLRTDGHAFPLVASEIPAVVLLFGVSQRDLWALDLQDGSLTWLDDDVESSTVKISKDGAFAGWTKSEADGIMAWARGQPAPVELLADGNQVDVSTAGVVGSDNGWKGPLGLWDGVQLQHHDQGDLVTHPRSPDVIVYRVRGQPVRVFGVDAELEGRVGQPVWSNGAWAYAFDGMLGLDTPTEQHRIPFADGLHIEAVDSRFVVVVDQVEDIWAVGWDGSVHHPWVKFRELVGAAHEGYFFLGVDHAMRWWRPGGDVVPLGFEMGPDVVEPDAYGSMLFRQGGNGHGGHARYVPVAGTDVTVFDDVTRPTLAPNGDWVFQQPDEDRGSIVRWNPATGRQVVQPEGRFFGELIGTDTPVGTMALRDLDGTFQVEVDTEPLVATRVGSVILTVEGAGEGTRLLAHPWR